MVGIEPRSLGHPVYSRAGIPVPINHDANLVGVFGTLTPSSVCGEAPTVPQTVFFWPEFGSGSVIRTHGAFTP